MAEPVERLVVELERTLKQLIAEHEQLGGLLTRKREALQSGQTEAVIEVCRLENEKVQRISELEKARLKRVADLTLALDPTATAPLRMREVAERLAEPARGRVLVLRETLRERMRRVQREAGVARRATETLVRHMQGLVRSVAAIGEPGAAYGERGVQAASAPALSTLNMTA